MAESAGAVHSAPLPQRAVRTYWGVWALTWDAVVQALQKPEILQARGQKIESAITAQAGDMWENIANVPSALARATRKAVRRPFVRLEHDLAHSSAVAEEELERQVDWALERLGIPTRDRIVELSRDIDLLTARIDRELDRLANEDVRQTVYR